MNMRIMTYRKVYVIMRRIIKRLDEEQLAKVNKDTVIGNIKGINVLTDRNVS